MLKASNSENGYVLFEALLAVAILSIGMTALMQAFQKSVYAVQYRQHYSAPARNFADALLAKFEIAAAVNQIEAASMSGERGVFRYEFDTSDWPAAPYLQRVSVTVRWMDRGKPGSITLTTLFLKPALKDEISQSR
ncbi:MAG: hypothetical protein ACE5IR_04395 [bacterium]